MIINKALGNMSFGSGEAYFSALLSAAITFILVISAIAFIFWFLMGGLAWITSAGDKQKAETARTRISQAVFGLILVLSTWAIISLIESIFTINITTISFSDFYIR